MKRRDVPPGELVAHDAHTAKGALRQAREAARLRCQAHALALFREEFGQRASADVLDIAAVVADMVQIIARTQKTTRAVAIHEYLEGKLADVAAMTEAEAEEYEPAADRGWP